MIFSSLPEIIFIVGPTASGKSEAALALAGKIPCEILSCDAMQVYRGIAIASGKPSAAELKSVPNHLLDLVSLEEEFDVAAFNKAALQAVDIVLKNKKIPLIVGGSGMYAQILLDGIFDGGGRDEKVREKLLARLEKEGPAALHAELKKVDPPAAKKIHANDGRRLVRALEVFYSTQTPMSEMQRKRSGLWDKYRVAVYGLERSRGDLYSRIDARVEAMFDAGLVDEIRSVEKLKLSPTAARLIGIKEVLDYVRGNTDLQTAKETMKKNTRRFAKRQMTWFRKDKRINWIPVKAGDTAAIIAGHILKEIKLS